METNKQKKVLSPPSALLFICFLATSFFLFGCTEQVPGIPYTTSQLINRSTDLNYITFINGGYSGECLKVDGNKITTGSCADGNIGVDVNWSQLIGFPVGCGAGEAVQIIGTSLTCISVGGTDTNLYTAGIMNPDYNSIKIDFNFELNKKIYLKSDLNHESGELIRLVFDNLNNPASKATIAFQNYLRQSKAWLTTHYKGTNGTDHNHFSIEVSDSTGQLQSRIIVPFDTNTSEISFNQANVTIKRNSGYTNGNLIVEGGWRDIDDFKFYPYQATNATYALDLNLQADNNILLQVLGSNYLMFGDSIIPSSNNTYSSGVSGKQWQNIYSNNYCDTTGCYKLSDMNTQGSGTDTNWQTSWTTFDANMKATYPIKADVNNWGDARYTPLTRKLGINGTVYDLSMDRNWTIASGSVDVNGARFVGDVNFDGNVWLTNTVWDDIYVPITTARLGTNAPDLTDFNGAGTYAYEFQDNILASEDEVYFTFQMPHSYKLDSNFEAHAHWGTDSTNTGNSRFKLTCSKANINGAFTTTISYLDLNATSSNFFGKQTLTDANNNYSCSTVSCVMQCTLRRTSSDALDTYASGLYFHAIDFHIEMDSIGSREELSK